MSTIRDNPRIHREAAREPVWTVTYQRRAQGSLQVSSYGLESLARREFARVSKKVGRGGSASLRHPGGQVERAP